MVEPIELSSWSPPSEDEALSSLREQMGAANEKAAIAEVVRVQWWTNWYARGVSAAMAVFTYVAVEHPSAPGLAIIVYLLARMPTKIQAGTAHGWLPIMAAARGIELATRRIQLQLAGDDD